MYQDQDLDCSWLHLPSQEQLITIQEWDTTERMLEHRGEAEAPPAAQRPIQTSSEGKRSGYMLTTSPSPWSAQHPAKSSPLNLWFLQEEKRTSREKPVLLRIVGPFVGAPSLTSHDGDGRGICGAQPLVIWPWQISRQGPSTTSTQILADRVYASGAQLVMPASSLPICRTKSDLHWPGNFAGCRNLS